MLQDWKESILRQAGVLDGVIHEFFGQPVQHILDAACGIGTQSLGLAQLGYTVTASDISAAKITRAQAEAVKRHLLVEFGVADMRGLCEVYPQPFDVVIACDNAIPHLLSNADILRTFEQFYQCTLPTGGCIISVRDYTSLEERIGRKLYPRTVHDTADGRMVIFDMWEFDGDYYDFTTYVVESNSNHPCYSWRAILPH
jgi:SAM-dependent methyltransferase